MLITTCPSCGTKYRQKNDKSLDNSTLVECCICGYDWIISPLNTICKNDDKFKSVNEKLKNIKKQRSVFPIIKKIILAFIVMLAVFLFAEQPTKHKFLSIPSLDEVLDLAGIKPASPPIFILIDSNANQVIDNKNIFKMKILIRNIQTQTITNPKIIVEMLDFNNNLLGIKIYQINSSIKPKQAKLFNLKIIDPKLGTTNFRVKYTK